MAVGNGGLVGTSVPRVDGPEKITGTAVYVDDLRVEGCLWGATVRSTHPHGRLKKLHRDAAFDWSRVTVVTAADIPGRNVIALLEDDQPALVPEGGLIRHAAEPVALVAAADRAQAQAAARAITLEVDPMPPVLEVKDALEAGAGSIQKRLEIARGGDVEAALAACDLVIEGIYRTGAQEQMYIEPQGMLARWDAPDRCHVTGSMQCPYYVRNALEVVLGIEGDTGIAVTQAATGGAFGGKEEYPSMIAAHAALLARKAGAPVKLIYERGEDIAATTKRHPALIRHRLGLRADGRFVALDVDLVLDGGAYVTLSPVVLSRAILHASGAYRFDHARIVGRVVTTNHPPFGAFRGFGAPQALFAVERQVDKAARRLGVDPWELRWRNRLRAGDSTTTGQRLGSSVASTAVLEAVAPAMAVPRRSDRGPGAPLRGRGLALAFHGSGFTGSGEERLASRVAVAVGGSGAFEVRTSSTEIGQGMKTTLTQIAAEALDAPLEAVIVIDPDTRVVPDSGPTVASRTCMVVGSLVEAAARRLRERLVTWAATRGLASATLPAMARAAVEAGEALVEIARYTPPPGIRWDEDTYTGAAYPVFGWAACVVDVAVDPDTYEVTVERCLHAVDVGRAIHPLVVRGQIEGGTLQALGWALLEDVVYREGQVANCSMADCIVPTAVDAPDIETVIVEEPYRLGPQGAKGVGEIPMDGPAAAVANAIENALGIPCDALPILPERIERALRNQEPPQC